MRIPFLVLSLAFAAPAAAQHLLAYDPAPGTGLVHESQSTTRMLPGPLPPVLAYPVAPVLPAVAFGAAPPGDATHDGLDNLVWHTNGILLAAQRAPNFPGAVLPPPPPPFPIAAGVLGMLGGPVTGIAIQPIANVMFLTSAAGFVVGVTPVPGTPVVVPMFAPAFVMGPVTGLDYDSMTNSLYAVDVAGVVYNFAIGGAPLMAPIFGGPLPAVAGDVAIDKSGYVNPAGVRPIHVVAGPIALDVTFAAAMPQPTGAAQPTGCAFLARPASSMPGVPACPCGPLAPDWRANAPMVSGNAAFGLRVDNLPAFSPVLMAFDGVFNPAFPLINVSGCGLGLFLGSPTIATNFLLTNGAGTGLWNLPLTFLPPGIGPIWAQAFYPCAADPAGFAITQTLQVSVCGH